MLFLLFHKGRPCLCPSTTNRLEGVFREAERSMHCLHTQGCIKPWWSDTLASESVCARTVSRAAWREPCFRVIAARCWYYTNATGIRISYWSPRGFRQIVSDEAEPVACAGLDPRAIVFNVVRNFVRVISYHPATSDLYDYLKFVSTANTWLARNLTQRFQPC
jgi:hypothetical protein